MRLGLVSLVALTLTAACGSAPNTATTSLKTESSAPQVLPLAAVENNIAGKPVVYLFTAPGCASCADQAQALATAARARSSIQLVGVDLTNDKPADFAAYVTAIGLAQSRFMWTIDQAGALARRYGVVSLSSSVFVTSDGQVRFVNSAPQDAQTLAAQLSQLS